MTEQEAKLILDVRISRFDHAEDVNEALEIAKQALEEIQRYRGIGTVEEIKTVKKYIELKKRCGTPSNTIDLCAEYAAIKSRYRYSRKIVSNNVPELRT